MDNVHVHMSHCIQALKNVELERALLCTEVTLHQRDDELISCQIKNKRLLHEVEQLRNTSSKAVKQFEKRTIEGIIIITIHV